MARVNGRANTQVAMLIGLGVAIRLLVASREIVMYDLANILTAGRALGDHGFSAYGALTHDGIPTYPYPPAFLPWAWLAGLPSPERAVRLLSRLPQIAADAGIAWVVSRELLARKMPQRRVLAGVALISLNPVMVALASRWGQLDAVAFLPAILAVLLWQRGVDHRAIKAGLLIGLAVSIKTPPVFTLFALIPSTASWRELAKVCAVAGGVVMLSLAPFLAADADSVISSLSYHGIPGQAGLSALLQPELVQKIPGPPLSPVVSALDSVNAALVLATGLGAGLWLRRWKTPALPAAAFIFLLVYIVGIHWFAQYAVWTLPFLILAGHLRLALIASVGYAIYAWPIAIPLWIRLSLPGELSDDVWIVTAWVLWLTWVVSAAVVARSARQDVAAV